MGRQITFKGKPLTLVGRVLKLGALAPDFKVLSADLKEVSLADLSLPDNKSEGRVKVISTFPSLDTPVCDLQVKEFNKRAKGLSSGIIVVGISKDLPFAQKRFCQANEIRDEIVLSDYKLSSFGINYGLLIKELNLLGRAAMILDKNDILRYMQITGELTAPLDYADVLKSLKEVIENPAVAAKEELPSRCKPCEIGSPALAPDMIKKLLAGRSSWQLVDDKKITREFKFSDFQEAKYFLDLVSVIAEGEGHHPTLTLIYNKLKITLTTHAASGLTENDFIMAGIIDELGA